MTSHCGWNNLPSLLEHIHSFPRKIKFTSSCIFFMFFGYVLKIRLHTYILKDRDEQKAKAGVVSAPAAAFLAPRLLAYQGRSKYVAPDKRSNHIMHISDKSKVGLLTDLCCHSIVHRAPCASFTIKVQMFANFLTAIQCLIRVVFSFCCSPEERLKIEALRSHATVTIAEDLEVKLLSNLPLTLAAI